MKNLQHSILFIPILKFYKDISVADGLSREVKIEGQSECLIIKKNISNGKVTEIIDDRSET